MNKQLVASLVLVGLFLCVTKVFVHDVSRPTPGAPPRSRLLEEFREISIPAADLPVDSLTAYDRGTTVGAVQHFRSASPADEIFDFYRRELPRHGWVVVGARQASYREKSLKFCKGVLSLTIDVLQETGSSFYYVGIVWVKHPPDISYCGPER